ncbi:MAG: hypothetical protein HY332_06475 [Chloroflexi bacterium]|nr:hypothetical protein [Chloroflexota bacterium]
MSRAALTASTARAAADAAAVLAAVVAGDEARRASEARSAWIASANGAVTGSGPLPRSIALTADERHWRELVALVDTYPIGAVVQFRTYDPTIRPRDWRRVAERTTWGLRRGDRLDVVGYGATSGFPEALTVRRMTDGADGPAILVFPDELTANLTAVPDPSPEAT